MGSQYKDLRSLPDWTGSRLGYSGATGCRDIYIEREIKGARITLNCVPLISDGTDIRGTNEWTKSGRTVECNLIIQPPKATDRQQGPEGGGCPSNRGAFQTVVMLTIHPAGNQVG